MSGTTKMGFEGLIYYGGAGSTASTLLENTTDISYNITPDKGSTRVRGDSSGPPIHTEDVTGLVAEIEWTMIEDDTDSALEALKTAAALGDPVAIRTESFASGKGYDGDMTLTMKEGMPLQGEETVAFTGTPTRQSGRMPQLHT